MGVGFVLYFILQLPWLIPAGSSDCKEKCGDIDIRSPFGIKTGCYHNSRFRVTCNQTADGPKPYITSIGLELLDWSSHANNIVIVNNPVTYLNCVDKGNNGSTSPSNIHLQGSPFFFSSRYNAFGSIGCGNLATIFRNNETTPTSSCLQESCGDLASELGSCYVTISENFTSYTSSIVEVTNPGSNRCASAFLISREWADLTEYPGSSDRLLPPDPSLQFLYNISINTTHLPAALEWNPCDLEVGLCDQIFKGVATQHYMRYDRCAGSCGNVDIPYPFGIEVGCYMNKWFRVTCNDTSDGPKPYITSIGLQLLNVSIREGMVVVNNSITYSNCLRKDGDANGGVSVNLADTPFSFSAFYNRFMSVGCGSLATFLRSPTDEYPAGGCMQPICGNVTSDAGCTTDFPWDLSSFAVNMKEIYPRNASGKSCTSSFIADQRYLEMIQVQHRNVASNWTTTHVPVTLRWSTQIHGLCDCSSRYSYTTLNGEYSWSNLNRSYLCVCASIADGQISADACQGCSTSLGTLVALIATWHLLKVLERRKSIKLKQKYFKRNGGLLLQQQLSSNEGNVERVRLFTSKELEKASDYFNDNRILGHGGQGTVYKGMLTDGSIVAIKKSNAMDTKKSDETKLKQFINEVMLLSQINHRNVVKLLGCCLETKVPLLVYEFIPNGTLSHLIHAPNAEFQLTWEMRLRIAIEIANALSYLHSAASVPIYHRDIKSSNILLDDKYRAKVSDFGTSRSVALEQTHVTTRVQGTFGYLDPEYFRSSKFTEKSDVYSFGVVLAELITGQKPISSGQSEDDVRSLVNIFLLSMNEHSLLDIVDPMVTNGGRGTEIVAVAKLAKRCLNLNGKKRPTMKEVAIELEQIRSSEGANAVEQNTDEDSDIDDMNEPSGIGSCSLSSCTVNDSVTLSLDA
ncbi:wall associated kinase-like 1 [Hibiscus trionum]|uniref:Wall associated kinase-like 1 n=1 Tax=Hibiscus trionum TaxID=183268 RepID=A0A9W7MSA9_HIBTR|nr:wall associated kinase-like 1 [Hibiscus trionum]